MKLCKCTRLTMRVLALMASRETAAFPMTLLNPRSFVTGTPRQTFASLRGALRACRATAAFPMTLLHPGSLVTGTPRQTFVSSRCSGRKSCDYFCSGARRGSCGRCTRRRCRRRWRRCCPAHALLVVAGAQTIVCIRGQAHHTLSFALGA